MRLGAGFVHEEIIERGIVDGLHGFGQAWRRALASTYYLQVQVADASVGSFKAAAANETAIVWKLKL